MRFPLQITFQNIEPSQAIEEWIRTKALLGQLLWQIRSVGSTRNVRCVQIGNSGWLCNSRRREESQCGAYLLQLREDCPRLLGGGPSPRVYCSWS
jgi:hypothetical protein